MSVPDMAATVILLSDRIRHEVTAIKEEYTAQVQYSEGFIGGLESIVDDETSLAQRREHSIEELQHTMNGECAVRAHETLCLEQYMRDRAEQLDFSVQYSRDERMLAQRREHSIEELQHNMSKECAARTRLSSELDEHAARYVYMQRLSRELDEQHVARGNVRFVDCQSLRRQLLLGEADCAYRKKAAMCLEHNEESDVHSGGLHHNEEHIHDAWQRAGLIDV